jgi:Ni,Fe-hydrogenase III small subunit
VGDCGCNGGIFGESYASLGGIDKVLPVDMQVPGCPPTPLALLNGILTAVDGYPGRKSQTTLLKTDYFR